MSGALVAQAIKTRIEADTGTGGLFNAGTAYKVSGVYFTHGSYERSLPYIVIDAPVQQDDTMDSDGGNVEWTVTVYDAANNALEKLRPIYARLHGNWVLQSGNPKRPTYGLHVHLLVLSTDSTDNPLGSVGSDVVEKSHNFGSPENDQTTIALVMSGETRYSKQGA